MQRRGASPLLAIMAVATPTPLLAQEPAFPPFVFADIDFQPDCRPNSAFERVLTVLHGGVGHEDPAVDTALYDAVAGDTFHRLILDAPVDWHGLRLKEIDLQLGIERGPANYTMVFDNPPAEVREAWNARGWQLPPVGERRKIDGPAGSAWIMLDGVEGPGEGAAVTCFRD